VRRRILRSTLTSFAPVGGKRFENETETENETPAPPLHPAPACAIDLGTETGNFGCVSGLKRTAASPVPSETTVVGRSDS
jgi:hypothetical protein